MAANNHNYVQINSPDAIWPQEQQSDSGLHSSEYQREGCCPPFSASNKSEEDWSACLIYITATKTVQLCFLFEILAEYSDAE